MGREDRQSRPLLAGTPRVRVRPRELTGEVAARCERGGPFCIYVLHCHELRTGNTPKRLATSVRPNPSLHPTRYSGLRPLPRAGELKRSTGKITARVGCGGNARRVFWRMPSLTLQGPITHVGAANVVMIEGRPSS